MPKLTKQCDCRINEQVTKHAAGYKAALNFITPALSDYAGLRFTH